jgi:hypothetical protein
MILLGDRRHAVPIFLMSIKEHFLSLHPLLANDEGSMEIAFDFDSPNLVNPLYRNNSRPDNLQQKSRPTTSRSSPLLLLSNNVKVDDILSHHSKFSKIASQHRENPDIETLGFVTPWNNRGYDIVPPSPSQTNI